MSMIKEICETIQFSETESVFKSFNDLYEEFATEQTDSSRPINPIDLSRMRKEARKAGLEPFSKDLKESGIWFRMVEVPGH